MGLGWDGAGMGWGISFFLRREKFRVLSWAVTRICMHMHSALEGRRGWMACYRIGTRESGSKRRRRSRGRLVYVGCEGAN